MDLSRNNPFNKTDNEDDDEEKSVEEVSKMKEWVSLKLKELEVQNYQLKEENRKFNQELTKLKENYKVKKSYTPEVRRKFYNPDVCNSPFRKYTSSETIHSSSSDENEFFVTKTKFHLKHTRHSRMKQEKISAPRIEGTNITLLSGNSRPIYTNNRAGSLDRKLTRMKKLNFNDLKKQKLVKKDYSDPNNKRSRLIIHNEANSKPPTPPLHRFPSWESRIYEIANNGIKSAISTPVQQVKKFEHVATDQPLDSLDSSETSLPVFRNINGRLAKIRIDSFDSMSSGIENFPFFKSSTTSSGNESDSNNELKMGIADNDSDSSQDYALPPDAFYAPIESLKINADNLTESKNYFHNPNLNEKCGYLLKLSGKFKTWKRRWFVVKDGSLAYFRSQDDFQKNKCKLTVFLDETCKLVRLKECIFQLWYKEGKKNLHLSADCIESYNEWTRVITHTLTYNCVFRIQENQLPVIENCLVKVRLGHSIRCWAALYDRYIVYFNNCSDKVLLGYTELKNSKVQQLNSLDNINDAVFIYDETKKTVQNSISIHESNNTEPIYLLFFSKQDYDLWNYHLVSASSKHQICKSPFEIFLDLLSSVESSITKSEDFYKHHVWNNPAIIFANENITEPLTHLPNENLKSEAIKLFKSIQLFISVPIDFVAIDYHVSLVQNSLKVCFSHPELQTELYYQLIKQSTPEEKCKEFMKSNAIHMFLCSPHSIFNCDEPSSEKSSPSSVELSQNESSVKKFSAILLQCFQLLAITISVFEPKSQVLWLLRHHLYRSKDQKSEIGKYAIYSERALERVLSNGPRKQIPSRMEVLSILQRNPYKHSMPHSIPVHFSNGSYQVIGFDGSTTIAEFVQLINAEFGIRENVYSGFALYSDDPIDDNYEHLLNLNCKLADIISHWESNLRKYHLGKFESTRAIKLIYKHRLCLRKHLKNETDKERILWVYEINNAIINDRFPITFDLCIELMTLILQIENGDFIAHNNIDSIYDLALKHFLPQKFHEFSSLKDLVLKRWSDLSGRSTLDCVRIYLNCTRKWNLCGNKIFYAKVSNSFKYDDFTSLQLCKFFSPFSYIWICVGEDTVELLEVSSFKSILRIPHRSIVNFGGHKSHFVLTVNANMMEKFAPGSDLSIPFTEMKCLHGQRLLFAMPKRTIIEITMLLADYLNLMAYES